MNFRIDPALQALAADMYGRMGRNLAFYQGVELSLKVLLRCSRDRNRNPTSMTLGQLVGEFTRQFREEFCGSTPVESGVEPNLEKRGEEVTAARNRLAHNFFETEGVDSYTEAGIRRAIAILDRDLDEARAFYDELIPHIAFVLTMLREQPGCPEELHAHYDLTCDYAARRGIRVHYVIHDRDLADIVCCLWRAEAEAPPSAKVAGMTRLSWAGDYVRAKLPEFDPAHVGGRKLLDVVEGAGVFETKRVDVAGGGQEVLFRSMPPADGVEYHVFPA